MQTNTRPISAIARDIRANWAKSSYAAKPYIEAMTEIESVDDTFYCDDAKSVILYFLANAGTWRGDKAKAIKAELRALIK